MNELNENKIEETRQVEEKATKTTSKRKATNKLINSSKGGRVTVTERKRRDRACMLFLRNVCAYKKMDYRELLDGIEFDTPASLDDWEAAIKTLEDGLSFDYSKPYKAPVLHDKVVSKNTKAIPLGRGGYHTDKNGQEVMITNGRVMKFIKGSWRDIGHSKGHNLGPFTPIKSE